MKHLVVVVVGAMLLASACASSSELDNLEQRVVELEIAADQARVGETRSLNVTLRAERQGNDAHPLCKVGPERLDSNDAINVTNGADALIAISRIGEVTPDCTFEFIIPNVPADEPVYIIELGKANWIFRVGDLDDLGWTLELTG